MRQNKTSSINPGGKKTPARRGKRKRRKKEIEEEKEEEKIEENAKNDKEDATVTSNQATCSELDINAETKTTFLN